MASQTVDSLLLQTQVDDSGLTQQFNKQIQEVNRLTDQVNRASAAMRPITITADTKALSVAEQTVSDFFAGFKGAQVGNVVELLQAINTELVATGQTDFTSKLIAQLTEIRSGFTATSTEAEELQAIIDTLGQSKLPVAGAAGGGGPPPPPPVDQFSAFRRETAATNVAVSELTATMARGNAGNLAYGQGMARVSEAQRAEATAAETTATANQRLLTAFNVSGNEAKATAEKTASWERGLVALRAQQLGAGDAAEQHNTHLGRLRGGLTAVAIEASGAGGQFGRLASDLLLVGVGGPVATAVLAGFTVIAAVVESLSEAERKAIEQHEKLLDSFRQRVTAGDETGPAAERGAADKLRAEAPRQIAELEERIARNKLLGFNTSLQEVALAGARRALGEAESLILRDNARLEEERLETIKKQRAEMAVLAALAQSNIAPLAQGVGSGFTAPGTDANAAATQAILAAQLRGRVGDQTSLNAAFSAYIQLQDASLKLTEQRFTAETRAGQQALSNFQRLQQQSELLGAPASQGGFDPVRAQADADKAKVGLRTVEEQLLKNAAAADKLAAAADKALPGTEAAARLRAEADAFRTLAASIESAIGPSQRLLQAQQAQRIAAAGGGNLTAGAGGVAQLPTAIPAILQGIGQSGVTRDLEAGLIRDQQAAERAAQAITVLDTAIHRIAGAAGGLASVVAGILGIGQAAQAAVRDVVSLVGGLGDIKKANADITAARDAFKVAQDKGDVAGQAAAQNAEATAGAEKVAGVIGAVTAGLGLVGNILSIGAALDAEHNRIVAENSQRLAELSLKLDQSFQGAGGVQKAAGLTADVASVVSQTLNADALGALRIQDAFNEALKGTGLTLREFEQIVKQTTGIEVLDSKGHVLATTLEQANEAFRKVIQTITTPSTDPGATRSRLETEDKFGIGGRSADPQVAAVQREREVILQGVQLSDAEEARIRAINLETAKGRAEFLKWEQDLARRAVVGGVSDTELHDFKNVDELIQALGLGADAVAAFTQSIHAVSDQTANIPRSFKQFAAASAAEIAGLGPNVPQQPETPRLRGTDINIPVPPELKGTDGASLPAFVAALKESTLALKAVKEKPAVISGNTVHQTFPTNVGDIREFARLVAIAMKELGTADFSSGSGPLGF